jgi:hypothetical protein
MLNDWFGRPAAGRRRSLPIADIAAVVVAGVVLVAVVAGIVAWVRGG